MHESFLLSAEVPSRLSWKAIDEILPSLIENLQVLAFANVFCLRLGFIQSPLKIQGAFCGLAVLHYILYYLFRTWRDLSVQWVDSMGENRHNNHSASSLWEKTPLCIEGSVKGTINVSWCVYVQVNALIKQQGCSLSKGSERTAKVSREYTDVFVWSSG